MGKIRYIVSVDTDRDLTQVEKERLGYAFYEALGLAHSNDKLNLDETGRHFIGAEITNIQVKPQLPYKVSIVPMKTSHPTEPVTYMTMLQRPGYTSIFPPGALTTYQSTDLSKVQFDAQEWAEFFETTVYRT